MSLKTEYGNSRDDVLHRLHRVRLRGHAHGRLQTAAPGQGQDDPSVPDLREMESRQVAEGGAQTPPTFCHVHGAAAQDCGGNRLWAPPGARPLRAWPFDARVPPTLMSYEDNLDRITLEVLNEYPPRRFGEKSFTVQ